MSMVTEYARQRRCPRRTWWNFEKNDMKSFGLSCKDASDKDDLRVRIS